MSERPRHILDQVDAWLQQMPGMWGVIYETGVYWSSILTTTIGIALIAMFFLSSLFMTRKMYILTGRVYWFFDFDYSDDDRAVFKNLEEEYPFISKFSLGIMVSMMATGFVGAAVMILPFVWPAAAIALVPVCFVYSGYNARKKFLFLERLKGENA
jgi:chromate transport protein ChrA